MLKFPYSQVQPHFVFLIKDIFKVKKTKRGFTFCLPSHCINILQLDNDYKKEEKTLLTKIKTPTHNHPDKK
jgi:hypothetical protein